MKLDLELCQLAQNMLNGKEAKKQQSGLDIYYVNSKHFDSENIQKKQIEL